MNKIIENISLIGANPKNCGGTRKKSDIKYLVYHYTGNDGDTAKANAKYYQNSIVKSSAHYFVDDTSVIQSVGDLTVAWAVGGKKWADCSKTGGGKLYGVVTNTNSISIEMCDTVKDGKLMATKETLLNAAALGQLIMERYNIPIENVVRHFDVTGKHCPAYFMDETAWREFKTTIVLQKETDLMERRYNTLAEITAELPWAAPTVQKMIDRDILRGGDSGLDLSMDMIRMFVFNDRAGLYK